MVLKMPAWQRQNSLLHEIPVLKALAKAWFYVFIARRNQQRDKAEQLRAYIFVRRSSTVSGWSQCPAWKRILYPPRGKWDSDSRPPTTISSPVLSNTYSAREGPTPQSLRDDIKTRGT